MTARTPSSEPFTHDPVRGLFASRSPGHPDRPTDNYLIAKLERRMEVPFSSLDEDHPPEESQKDDGLLLVIAGGIDSHGGGDRASALAVETIRDYLSEQVSWAQGSGTEAEDEARFVASLEEAFARAEEVLRFPSDPTRRLLSSLTVACIFWPRMFVAHAGDGRAFRVRKGRCERLTRVHTVAQDFVDKGILTQDEAVESKFRHVLWNTIGGLSADVRPEIQKYTLRAGDRILLASDGLARSMSRKDLRDTLIRAESAPSAAEQLLAAGDSSLELDRTALVAFFPGTHPERVPASSPDTRLAQVRRTTPRKRPRPIASTPSPSEGREFEPQLSSRLAFEPSAAPAASIASEHKSKEVQACG